jgi:5-methyltetrahydropteroyltriglutamate--homocysteine methyltransferase
MCYSEFGDIMRQIQEMDADALPIEAARSKMELLEDWKRTGYENEIGPGLYDIHSPRIPSTEEMADLLRRAAEVLESEQLWVDPDCGLKTRRYEEVEPSLKNTVAAAKQLREESRPGVKARRRTPAGHWAPARRARRASSSACPGVPAP